MYHLVDRQLEKKLIGLDPGFLSKLYDGMFSSASDRSYEIEVDIEIKGAKPSNVNGTLILSHDHVEFIPDYNPRDWNNFPEIAPPKETLMRLECTMENGEKYIGSAWVGENGHWMVPWQSTTDFPTVKFDGASWISIQVKEGRYRAWE